MDELWRNWISYGLTTPPVALVIVVLATLNLLGIALICILIKRFSGSMGKAMSSRTPSDAGIAEKIAELDKVSANIVRTANETFDLLEKWANYLASHPPVRPPADPAFVQKATQQTQERIAELQRQGWKPDSIAGELKMSRDEAHLEIWKLRQSVS